MQKSKRLSEEFDESARKRKSEDNMLAMRAQEMQARAQAVVTW